MQAQRLNGIHEVAFFILHLASRAKPVCHHKPIFYSALPQFQSLVQTFGVWLFTLQMFALELLF